jgi:hypothetical protein
MALLERRKAFVKLDWYFSVFSRHSRDIGTQIILKMSQILSMQIESSKLDPLRFNGSADDRVFVKTLLGRWGPRRSPAAPAAGAGGRRQRACAPLLSHALPAPQGCATVLCFSALHRASDARRWRSVRPCVLGAGVHVGGQQARDFVFVEVAPCPCGQPLSYAVPLVCCGLFELPFPWRPCPSANLATSSWTTGLCSQDPPITAELIPPMRARVGGGRAGGGGGGG